MKAITERDRIAARRIAKRLVAELGKMEWHRRGNEAECAQRVSEAIQREARNSGLALALQLLIYPGTTAHQDTDSHRRYAHGLVLDEPAIDWFFAQYIPDHAQREDWRFAPLLAPDVDGVAPAWIGLAECDPLVDEGVEYADKLRMAGVPVDLEIYKGVTHEFVKMGRVIAEARQAHADMAAALKTAFGLN